MKIEYFLLSFVWFYWISWIAVSNDFKVFNSTLYQVLGIHFKFGEIILFLITSAFVYSLFSVANLVIKDFWLKNFRFFNNKKFQIFLLVVAIIGYLTTFCIWKAELLTVKLFFMYFAPLLHLCFNVTMSTLWFFKLSVQKKSIKNFWITLFSINLILVLVCTYSPSISDNINIKKPKVFAHRGNVKKAPENTLLAFQEAQRSGVDGFEADVAISFDGIPFLIHDKTLTRTTNVAKVFPDRKNDLAESFTWKELQMLDAGSWYLLSDPYGSVSTFSQRKRDKIKKQKIMALSDFAAYAIKTKKQIIFDYRTPMVFGHPYMFKHVQTIVSTLLKSGIDQTKVLWISGPQYGYVLDFAPKFTQVYGAHVDQELIKKRKLKMLILEYNDIMPFEVEKYEKEEIKILMYTSLKKWTFSLSWCEGAYGMISDDPDLHVSMKKPILLMTKYTYFVLIFFSFALTVIVLHILSKSLKFMISKQ